MNEVAVHICWLCESREWIYSSKEVTTSLKRTIEGRDNGAELIYLRNGMRLIYEEELTTR
jgi:hypothetical protein